MIDFTFNCPHCKQSLEASADMEAELIDCPSCNKMIEIPSPTHIREQAVARANASRTKSCPYCAEQIHRFAQKCKHCGEFLDEALSSPKKGKGSQIKLALVILVVTSAVIVLGLFHFVKGSSILGFRLVSRASFGFSEIVVDVDKITSMPLFSAKSRYPLGVEACQRAGFIETEEQFKKRAIREYEEEFEKEYRKQMDML